MTTMSLLTPSEVHAFQSFLEHIDYSDTLAAPEWAMYTTDVHDGDDEHAVPLSGNEQLAKAARDLMALDTNPQRFDESAHTTVPVNVSVTLSTKGATHGPISKTLSFSPQAHRPPLTVAPSRTTFDSSAASDSQPSSSDLTPPPPTPPSLLPTLKHSNPFFSEPGPGSSSSTDGSQPPAKKRRSSPPQPHETAPVVNVNGKQQTLLTPSQKKANHIQSEQKRRANIRRGYEALCDTVPALREAIRAEEEAQTATERGQAKSKKKSRSKKNDSGEKIDGRAGPRSENIVLQKTIDYIHELLNDREILLGRLNRSRSLLLPTGYPGLHRPSDGGPPLWEREWTGGQGIIDDGGDGDSDDDDDS